MTDMAIINRSVTRDDYLVGNSFFLRVGTPWLKKGAMLPDLQGMDLRESDMATLATLDHESIWAGAVGIAITQVSSLSWEVKGDIPLRTKRGQELLLSADAGRGWVSYISKLLQDFLLTNNGAFVEIIHATNSVDSPVIGLMPLDTMRCLRTGDIDNPVVYKDLKGREHQLAVGEVLEFSDMPSNRASMYGTGKCAAARAYQSIYELYCIQQYISDKVSGRRPLAINLINGMNDPQLKSVLATAQSEADAKGIISYMGAIIATVPGETAPGNTTIPLADFPDAFNRKEELDIAVMSYADNLGLDVQDIQPLTGRALGTGAQSQVLDEKASGKGLAAFRQQFVHAHNTWVLPDLTTMEFVEQDWRDKNLRADFNTKTEAYVNHSVERGLLSNDQGMQVLVDENVYPKEFLPTDQTPDTSLSDVEKPEEGYVPEQTNEQLTTPGESPTAAPVAAPPTVQPSLVVPQVKETTIEIMEQEAVEAMKLAKRIRSKTGKE